MVTLRKTGAIAVFSSLLLILAFAAEAVEIEVEGVGQDRRSAILDAQRAAVASVMGQYVDGRSLVMNYQLVSDRILTSSQGYVDGYQVLSESQDAQGYRVRIKANVISSSIKDDVNAIIVLQASRGNPRFMVVPDPSPAADAFSLGDPAVGEAMRGIQEYLSERQINTVQGPMLERSLATGSPDMLRNVSHIAADLGAEYAVYYSVIGKTKGRSRTFARAEAIVNISVVKTGNYRIIAQVEGRAEGTDNTDIDFAYREAARTAAKNAAAKALEQVLADWTRQGTTAGATYMVNIQNIEGSDLGAFEEALERSGAVKRVDRRSLEKGRAVMEVLLDGDIRDLGDAIGFVLQEKDWDWALVAAESASLTYRVPSEPVH